MLHEETYIVGEACVVDFWLLERVKNDAFTRILKINEILHLFVLLEIRELDSKKWWELFKNLDEMKTVADMTTFT